MRKAILLITSGIAVFLVAAVTTAGAFNLKPGLWELTMTSESSGAPPIPDAMMSRLTPEQRARIQAAMQSRMNHPTQHTYKRCLTREEIDNPFKPDKQNESEKCVPTVLSKTASSEDVKVVCTGDVTSSIIYRWQAPTPESMTGTMDSTAGGGEHVMKTNGHMSGKWIGADCGDVK